MRLGRPLIPAFRARGENPCPSRPSLNRDLQLDSNATCS